MNNKTHNFSDVSLLVTHYNRSRSLENLLVSFNALKCTFQKIIVSDDGSQPGHLDRVKQLQGIYNFDLITADCNCGLGNNINKGQDAVTSPYTLYIQEDFVPKPLFPEKLRDGIAFLEADHKLDIVRFYAYSMYPYVTKFEKGFSIMKMKPLGLRYKKIHYYSDHPHLRRSTFFEKFGRYSEGTKPDVTEYNMSISFIRNKGKGLFYNDHYSLLTQVNTLDEPSTIPSEERKKGMDFLSRVMRLIYRQIKYNYDIVFKS